MTHPIAKCGLPVTAGLKPIENPKPSGWQRLVYAQSSDNIWDKITNIGKLTKTEDLKGFDLFQARLSNLGAMYINPFAMSEHWRHLLSTGKMV